MEVCHRVFGWTWLNHWKGGVAVCSDEEDGVGQVLGETRISETCSGVSDSCCWELPPPLCTLARPLWMPLPEIPSVRMPRGVDVLSSLGKDQCGSCRWKCTLDKDERPSVNEGMSC